MTGNSHCPACRKPTTTTVDNDTAGLPVTLHPAPTSRWHALTQLATGHLAVVAESDRTWGQQSTRYYRLDEWRIHNTHLARSPHYVQHVCGVTPPPPDPPTPAAAAACDCSWCRTIEEGDTP